MSLIDLSNEKQIRLALTDACLSGDVVHSLKCKCRDLLAAKSRDIVFEVSKVRFVDSSAVGLILSLKQSMALSKGHLTLEGVNGPFEDLLRQMHLLEYFQIRHFDIPQGNKASF